MKRMIICVASIIAGAGVLYALTGREIMEKSDALPDPASTESRAVMKIYRNGALKETKEFQMYSKKYGQDSRVLIRFIRPTKIKFLTHSYKSREDLQWLKTSSGKPKKIVGSDSGKPFVLSHFFYEDLKGREIDDYNYTLRGEESIPGGECYKVEAAKKSGDKVYDRIELFVRKSDYFVVRVNFYQKGKLLKFLTNYDIKSIDGILTPLRMVMSLPDGKGKTEITVTSVKHNIPVNDSLFNKGTL
ncbi:MAG: outer membrane lipoprotein-sorting protein [Spirochaetes bacterium]|nr:outer membrane lipoprotein-sorting protein [Spirochaetota bacterium]